VKTMTCEQLGGACAKRSSVGISDEIEQLRPSNNILKAKRLAYSLKISFFLKELKNPQK